MVVMTVSLYGYMILVAFALGYGFVALGLKRNGVPGRIAFYSVFLNAAVTVYCAKLYTVINSRFRTDWFRAGFSALGGALGLLAGVLLFDLIYRRDRSLFFRLYALAIPGMYGISKLGCYTAGCCHGIPYDGPLCVSYPNRVPQVGPYFPVQLLESMVFLGIFALGVFLCGRLQWETAVGIVILLCAAGKFTLEYLRAEHMGVLLSMNQIVCIGFVFFAFFLLRENRSMRGCAEE